VVEAAFKQAVARRGGQIVAVERYAHDKAAMAGPVKTVAQAAARADALFIPDGGDAVPDVVQALVANGVNTKKIQLLGTGLWDDQRIYSTPALDGGWYAAPDSAGFRAFAGRYRTRYNQEPARTATLAYDAVALIAALVKTQGPQRFSSTVLTNPSGFTGIDGLFRFRSDGTNDRGLAVLRVTPSGPQTIAPPQRGFGASAT
jgi:ABC-type branched-subunit amino acid transport system substrate-binding protein